MKTKILILFFTLLVSSQKSLAARDNINYFIHTSTYGLIAGSLLGAASLAFTSDPGNHMSNVFKGASLGLYGGMIFGAYKIYNQDDNVDYAFIPFIGNSGKLDGAYFYARVFKF